MASKDVWSPKDYNTNASFTYSLSLIGAVIDLLNAQPEERILDIGCSILWLPQSRKWRAHNDM